LLFKLDLGETTTAKTIKADIAIIEK